MHESYDTSEQTYLLHNFYLLSFHKCSFIPKYIQHNESFWYGLLYENKKEKETQFN